MTRPEAAPGPQRVGLDSTTKIILFSFLLCATAAGLGFVAVAGHHPVFGSTHIAWPLLALGFAIADSFAVHVELRDNARNP